MEFADELADGARGAALPLIRHDLGLSYAQLGLLASVPLLAGGALELPLGMLAGHGRRRRIFVLGGGVVFVLALAGAALAPSFDVLLAAFTIFYPASGAFVSLTQAGLMDAWPQRQPQVMARWELAGSAGAVAGPLLLAAVLAAGGGWRAGYLALAGLAAAAWAGACLREDVPAGACPDGPAAGPGRAARAREVLAALRHRDTVRWLVLLQIGDLLVDVLTGFLAVYLVEVAHLRPAVAALAIAIRLGAGLAGDATLVLVLKRVSDLTVLRASAAAAMALYPAFLLVPGIAAKLALLAALSAATATWYPLLQARLYCSLPGRSPVAVTLSSAAGFVGGLGPLAVGLLAAAFGLPTALALLAAVPPVMLAACARSTRAGMGREGSRCPLGDDFALDQSDLVPRRSVLMKGSVCMRPAVRASAGPRCWRRRRRPCSIPSAAPFSGWRR